MDKEGFVTTGQPNAAATEHRRSERTDEPWPPAVDGRLHNNDAAARLGLSPAMITELIYRGMLRPISVIEEEVLEIAADRQLLSLLRRADKPSYIGKMSKGDALDKEVEKARQKVEAVLSKTRKSRF